MYESGSYRYQPEDDYEYASEPNRLLIWAVMSGILLIFLGFLLFFVITAPVDEDDVENGKTHITATTEKDDVIDKIDKNDNKEIDDIKDNKPGIEKENSDAAGSQPSEESAPQENNSPSSSEADNQNTTVPPSDNSSTDIKEPGSSDNQPVHDPKKEDSKESYEAKLMTDLQTATNNLELNGSINEASREAGKVYNYINGLSNPNDVSPDLKNAMEYNLEKMLEYCQSPEQKKTENLIQLYDALIIIKPYYGISIHNEAFSQYFTTVRESVLELQKQNLNSFTNREEALRYMEELRVKYSGDNDFINALNDIFNNNSNSGKYK